MPKTTRLFFFVVLIEIALLAYGDIVIRKFVIDRTVAAINQQQLSTVKFAALSLETDVRGVIKKLSLIALSDQIQAGNASSCSQKLKEALPSFDNKVRSLSRLNTSAVIDCSTIDLLIGANRADQEHLKQILSDEKHQPVVSRIFDSPADKKKIISLSSPIFSNDGRFLAITSGGIELETIYDNYLTKSFSPTDSYLVILDDNGDIISHADKKLIGKNAFDPKANLNTDQATSYRTILTKTTGREADIITYRSAGEEILAAYSVINVSPNHHWVAIFRAPKNSVLQELIQPGTLSGITSLVGINLIFAFAIIFTSGVIAVLGTIRVLSQILAEKIRQRGT